MPITQQQIVDLMQESRGNIDNHAALCQQLSVYIANAKERFYANADLAKVLEYLAQIIQYNPPMVDKWTERNEYHYRRTAKANKEQRERAQRVRAARGVPTVAEALAILHAKNALRRAGLPTEPEAYMSQEAKTLHHIVGTEEKTALAEVDKFKRDFAAFERANPQFEGNLAQGMRVAKAELGLPLDEPTYVEIQPQKSKVPIKYPREFDDDKPLEFDTAEDLAPFANIPAPKDAENLSTGLDFQPIAGDDDQSTTEEKE